MNKKITRFILYTQVKEWYGLEDSIGNSEHGRYKNKGGQDFIFEGPDDLWRDYSKLIEKFNTKYDRVGRFFRYEAKELESYPPPYSALFVDGEIRIPEAAPIDEEPI